MTEYESFEEELAALQPHPPSAELRQRIAQQLASASTTRHDWRFVGILGGGLIAASFAVLAFWQGDDPFSKHRPRTKPNEPLLNAAFDAAAPSFWTYRTALNQSPESLDDLLDRHAARASEPKPERARVFVITAFDNAENPLVGEL